MAEGPNSFIYPLQTSHFNLLHVCDAYHNFLTPTEHKSLLAFISTAFETLIVFGVLQAATARVRFLAMKDGPPGTPAARAALCLRWKGEGERRAPPRGLPGKWGFCVLRARH